MRTPITPLLTASLALVAIVGCALPNAPVTQSKTVSDNSLPKGWKRVEAKGEHLSIAVPSGWTPIDFSTGEFSKISDTAAQANPDLADMKPQLMQAAQNKAIKLFIFHKRGKVKFAPNINVIETPKPPGTLDEIVKENEDQLKSIATGPTTKESVQVGGQEGALVKWQMPIQGIAGLTKVDIFSYIGIIKDNAYYITFTMPPGSETEKDVEPIIKTFRAG